MMVEEWKAQGETNEDIAKYASLVVTWKELGGGNYQLYICLLYTSDAADE